MRFMSALLKERRVRLVWRSFLLVLAGMVLIFSETTPIHLCITKHSWPHYLVTVAPGRNRVLAQ